MPEIKSEDVKDSLLPTSEFGKHMQEDIDMYITRDRLNEASFCRKLNPIAQSIICGQNQIELVFNDVLTFDAQNLVIGLLMTETDVEKKDLSSKLLSKAPNPVDMEIQSRFQALKKRNDDDNFNNSNNNFGGFPPPSPTLPPILPLSVNIFCQKFQISNLI